MVEPQIKPSITKLQAFAWKIQAPPKLKNFIWQAISGQLAVTNNLTHQHMRCDNHCPRCGAEEETINHVIFECPPAIQTWAHASTPTPPERFPSTSHYTDIDYLFWRKNDIEDPELDKDPTLGSCGTFGKRKTINYSKDLTGTLWKLSITLNQNVILGLKLITNRKNQKVYKTIYM